MGLRTAILLFSRTAKEEVASKQLLPNASFFQKRNIAAALIRHTQRIAKASQLPILQLKRQQGNTFGERLYHAFQQGFAQGYEQIIAIGNDSPELSVQQIRQAAQHLEKGHVVLGPALDGGVYLLGLNKTQFERFPCLDLPWQTDQLCSTLEQVIKQKSWTVSFLEPLADIDDAYDFGRFLKSWKGPLPLFRTLQAIISQPIHFIQLELIYQPLYLFIQFLQRPPPFYPNFL